MVNYSKGLIYKLCCNDQSIKDIYIGSTTNFIRRKCTHKSACTNPNDKAYNYYVYKFIRENGNWSNWSMILVREYKTSDKLKLKRKERKYIQKFGATLNCTIPTRTKKEWYNENQDEIEKKTKQYREANKDNKQKYDKTYYQHNKETKKLYSNDYRLQHNDEIKSYMRDYYKNHKDDRTKYIEANKVKISQYKKEKIECECGCMIRRSDLSKHKKTQKHKDLMNEQ